MKRFITILVTLAMVFALAACGGKSEESEPKEKRDDILAGTTYQLTEVDFGSYGKTEADKEKGATIVFDEYGNFTFTAKEDVSLTKDFKIEHKDVDVSEKGTYEVEPDNTVTLTFDNNGEDIYNIEDDKLVKYFEFPQKGKTVESIVTFVKTE